MSTSLAVPDTVSDPGQFTVSVRPTTGLTANAPCVTVSSTMILSSASSAAGPATTPLMSIAVFAAVVAVVGAIALGGAATGFTAIAVEAVAAVG